MPLHTMYSVIIFLCFFLLHVHVGLVVMFISLVFMRKSRDDIETGSNTYLSQSGHISFTILKFHIFYWDINADASPLHIHACCNRCIYWQICSLLRNHILLMLMSWLEIIDSHHIYIYMNNFLWSEIQYIYYIYIYIYIWRSLYV